MKTKRNLAQTLIHVTLIVLMLINIAPIFWMISSAFKVPTELFTTDIRLIPHQPTWDNFRIALFEYDFFSWLTNSVISTLGIAVLQVVVSLLAAFALSYFDTRMNAFVFYFLIATMVVPFQVTMIPNYILVSRMGWTNTNWGVIVANIAHASTFFFLRQHIRGIPVVYYEVATLEGGGSMWTVWNVVVGLCKGAISAILILTVIEAWNLYFWPLLVLTKPESRTLTIGLQQFLDFEAGNRWGPFMATATLATMPILVTYLCIQRNIIDAFVSSGIKG